MHLTDLLDRVPFGGRASLPDLGGATAWVNSEPLAPADLRGHVVLVDFWTFTCINWIRTLPYLRQWADAYQSHGLVMIGVHTPEFTIEHRLDNVRSAVRTMGLDYPIAVDTDYAIWNRFANQYWPAVYLADSSGRIRQQVFGERNYERLESSLRRLLTEAGSHELPDATTSASGSGIEAAADWSNLRSPETYVGWARATGFASTGGADPERSKEYGAPTRHHLNEWSLSGPWVVRREAATLDGPQGVVTYRFHARDLNLVLAPPAHGAPARIQVRLDGDPPGDHHGVDLDAEGCGVVEEPRLYQLIRQRGAVRSRTCEIQIRGVGAAAFCFTFG